ncbi:AN1-type zinc finger protein 5-like [Grus japonensis]|uniref:AN1-type zinc finger protein 5-like n=1 Tax=Grus japonensis TaxID=30415 RepID=A0ABC9WLV8_GRUJA
MEKTMVRQAVPLQPMEVDGGADIHLQPMEDPMLEQVDAPEGGCDPMGSPHWSRLLAGPMAPWSEEPMLEQDTLYLSFCMDDTSVLVAYEGYNNAIA